MTPAEPARIPLLAGQTTPLVGAPRLSSELGTEIWFKRDDLTGFGLGGNKVRVLEYLLADAVARDSDCLVTGAGTQSNWAMLAGLAAVTHGLEAFVVHYGMSPPFEGNLRLSRLVGTTLHFTGDPERTSVDTAIHALADRLRAEGRRPYVIPRGGATPIGVLGYVRCANELATQLRSADVDASTVWLATGSCGTQAGLVTGARWAGLGATIVGVTVSRPASECRERIAALAGEAADLVGRTRDPAPFEVVDGFLGDGYGEASPSGRAAAQFVARTEGVFLDPVFGAKAMAALIDRARSRSLPAGPVVFVVTGGTPTIFVQPDPTTLETEDEQR